MAAIDGYYRVKRNTEKTMLGNSSNRKRMWFMLSVFLAAFLLVAKAQDATDALIVLTTVGYLTGAADGCGVAAQQSNALSSGISMAINAGKYGDPAQGQVLLNNARQKGVGEAAAKRVDCSRVEEKIRALLSVVFSSGPAF